MSLLDVEPIFHSRVVLDHAHTVRGRRFRFHCHLRRQVDSDVDEHVQLLDGQAEATGSTILEDQ